MTALSNAAPAGPSTADVPPVTVVICTRNRGAQIVATVDSVLACPYPLLTLLIIDQSGDDATLRALGGRVDLPIVTYIRSASQGLSRARNIGLARAQTEIVLMTDDDCEVPPDWVGQMTAALLSYPQAGLMFCDVIAGPHDPRQGFVPVSVASGTLLIASLGQWRPADGINIGIGAGMAMRRTIARDIGGFDEALGAGSRFHSGEDIDMTLRMLLRGHQIYRTDAVRVVHHGFRLHKEGRRLVLNSMFSIGAIYGKLIRCGQWRALGAYLLAVWAMVVIPLVASLARLQKPPVVGRMAALAGGLIVGLRTPANRRSIVFISGAPASADGEPQPQHTPGR
jgi:GT2 family glycosyltransferase